MEISKVDETVRSSSQSLAETYSSAMNLSISSRDLSKENEVLYLVNQASHKSINETSPNLLFEIKKLRMRNLNKIVIANLRRNFLLVTCYSLLFTRYSLLCTRYFVLVTRYFLLNARYFLLVTFYSLLIMFYSLLVAFYSLLVTFYQILVTFYSLLVTFYLLLVIFYTLM